MAARYDVLIVGAGHAGAQTAIALRQGGFTGSIALLGDEPDPPYERPPLSKAYLKREKPFERMLLRPLAFWVERDIVLRLGERAAAVDAAAHAVTLEGGGQVGYGSLVWATGGAPRRLGCVGEELAGVHAIRTRADVDRLEAELASVRDIVVVGGGYIGLEAAAALVALGHRPTVLEAQERVLARVTGEPLSRFYEDEHRRRGVTIRLGAKVDRLLDQAGRVSAVRLHDGEELSAQLVVVGVGVVPAVGPLLAAGAAGVEGVEVDARCATSLLDVYAVGDVARHANAWAGGTRLRLESVQNATDQASVAAKAILGQAAVYDALPWFWSDQYDLKLQTIGLSTGHDTIVVRGDPTTRSFTLVYLKEGVVMALDCVNSVKDFVQGRTLVQDHRLVDTTLLTDPAVPLSRATGAA